MVVRVADTTKRSPSMGTSGCWLISRKVYTPAVKQSTRVFAHSRCTPTIKRAVWMISDSRANIFHCHRP
uniref:Uncharacterized protein n=1 Tax=Anopheles maculatus TaxID=74869 RepID=A0A182SPB4_9DIPT